MPCRDGGRLPQGRVKGVKATIHQNHGLFSCSTHRIDSAAFRFIALGWLHFQTIRDQLIASQTDMFD